MNDVLAVSGCVHAGAAGAARVPVCPPSPAGCAYDAWNVEGCYPTVQAQVGLQFAYKPSDPLAAPLKKLAG